MPPESFRHTARGAEKQKAESPPRGTPEEALARVSRWREYQEFHPGKERSEALDLKKVGFLPIPVINRLKLLASESAEYLGRKTFTDNMIGNHDKRRAWLSKLLKTQHGEGLRDFFRGSRLSWNKLATVGSAANLVAREFAKSSEALDLASNPDAARIRALVAAIQEFYEQPIAVVDSEGIATNYRMAEVYGTALTLEQKKEKSEELARLVDAYLDAVT